MWASGEWKLLFVCSTISMPDKVTINTAYYKNNTQREQKGKRWFRIFSVATVTGRWLLNIISDLWLPKFPFACCSLSCYAALEATEIKQIGIDTISQNMRIMMKCQQQMSDMHCNFGKRMLWLQAWTQDAISNLGFKWDEVAPTGSSREMMSGPLHLIYPFFFEWLKLPFLKRISGHLKQSVNWRKSV